jgi:ligand-binding sensor domain-containing protein
MFRLPALLLLLLTGAARAQLPSVTIEPITDRDGLPSRWVECVAEDTSGFVWFGTRQGLTRYDGYAFRRVATNRQVHGAATDRAGTVWASDDHDRLLRVDANTLTAGKAASAAEGGGWNTFVDSRGEVWFSDRDNVNRYDPVQRRTYRYPMTKTTFIYNKGSFAEDSRGRVWVLGNEVGLFEFDRTANRLICRLGQDCPRPGVPPNIQFRRGFIDQQDQLWVAVVGTGLLRYDTRTGRAKFYYTPPATLLVVCDGGTDNSGRPFFWIGTTTGLGVFRPDTETFAFFGPLLAQPFEVNHIFRSRRTGIVWVATSEGVLKYDSHQQFIRTNRLAGPTQPVTALLADRTDPTRQTVWLAAPRRGLCRWNRATNATTLFPFPQYAPFSEATWLAQDPATNRIWVGCNQWKSAEDGVGNAADNRYEGIFCFDPRAGRFVATPISVHHAFFSVPFYSLGLFDRRGRLWLANHYESLHVIDPKTNRELNLWPADTHADLFNNGSWLMRVVEDSRGRVWLATNRGLFWFDEPSRRFRRLIAGRSLLDMAQGPDGNLWVAGWQGLLRVSPAGQITGTWGVGNGLYDIECRRVTVDARGRVWIGTYDGLHRFDPVKNTFRRFTANDGLISSNTMQSLTVADTNTLLAGNMGGWNTLDLNALDRTTTGSNLRLTDVRVNNRPSPANWTRPVTLTAEQTAVSFDFSALNFRKPTDNEYSYFLEGQDKTWGDSSTAHQATYTNLDPGPYVFRVRQAGPGAGAELAVPFVVEPRFFEIWWFRLLAGLAVAGGLWAVYRNRLSYRTIKTRLELEEALKHQQEARFNEQVSAYQLKLSETEMTALRAQMNPHFIFNCLNSIQFFTAQNDSERASAYLSKFARLIRLVLENSRSAKVTLANELETVRLYIEMEAMRFPQKLHYVIEVEPDIETDTLQIPPLLLQPFVENAIWHGLMHREEGGTVHIAVQQLQPDRLVIDITDDGVGRAKAAEYKSKSATRNKSFGMKLTSERIDLINQLYGIQTAVRVTDLTDPHGHPLGTRVVIEIPV